MFYSSSSKILTLRVSIKIFYSSNSNAIFLPFSSASNTSFLRYSSASNRSFLRYSSANNRSFSSLAISYYISANYTFYLL